MDANDLREALQQCEAPGSYGQSPVKVSANGAEIVVISDLHLAAGRMKDGRFSGTENFFADSSLRRFIHAILGRLKGKPAILVINGDMVDFLRITEYPQSDEEFQSWQSLLQQLGVEKTIRQLQDSITPKEVTFGLKTHHFKSAWKLAKCVQGHPQFFDVLAEWIALGNRIIISKGNHDLEWYWREVRDCLRLVLAERLQAILQRKGTNLSLAEILVQHISANLLFVDDAFIIDGSFYIEHGHRYDKYTCVVGGPLLPGNAELNIPFGSFFNRYILNQVELAYPYVDNVRPTKNLLPLLIRERFFVAMKLLLYHVPFMFLIIPKGYFRYMFGQVAVLAAAVGIPLALAVFYLLASFPHLQNQLGPLAAMNWPGGNLAKSFISLAGSYLLSRMVAYFQLSEPSSLGQDAMKIFAATPAYRLITMGHTHNPDQCLDNGRWFYNTGTWIPIVELDTADVRPDRTYTFLHFLRFASGELQPTVVERWDDDAERAEDLIIISKD